MEKIETPKKNSNTESWIAAMMFVVLMVMLGAIMYDMKGGRSYRDYVSLAEYQDAVDRCKEKGYEATYTQTDSKHRVIEVFCGTDLSKNDSYLSRILSEKP